MGDLPDITRRVLERVREEIDDDDNITSSELHMLQSQISCVLAAWWDEATIRPGDTIKEFEVIYDTDLGRAVEHIVATFEILRGVARRDPLHSMQAVLRLTH